MLVFLIFSAFASFLAFASPPLHSAPLIIAVHSMCIEACPSVTHAEFMRAVVCGGVISNTGESASLKSDFVRTGLIHLLIVSGSHLIGLEIWVRFLSKVFRVSRLRDAFIFSSLAIFVVMTLATPPVFRAFASWTLSFLNRRWQLGWTRAQILVMSGACTLATCRTRWDLSSLSLSWIAALAFAWGAHVIHVERKSSRKKLWRDRVRDFAVGLRRDLQGHALVYAALIPALIPLGVPSALSILCNLAFAPVMGFILFPVSVLGYAGLASFADRTWSCALAVVKFVASQTPEPWSKADFSPVWLVPYIFALSIFLFVRERRRIVASALIVTAVSTMVHADELIVWNVGQGSWATLITPTACEHFDIGGEFAPYNQIVRACANRRNEVQFSHWDWDHIGLSKMAQRKLPNLCVQTRPAGETKSKMKLDAVGALPNCQTPKVAREIFGRDQGSPNEESRVYMEDGIIFPGDSPAKQEAKWRLKAGGARILIAGHHGSKTATSAKLLDSLHSLKLVLVSARKKKYGHPHPAMLARVREHLLPALMTEDWGSLHVEVNGERPQSTKSKKAFRIAVPPASRFRVQDVGTHRASP
jgi:competence protein ComEC